MSELSEQTLCWQQDNGIYIIFSFQVAHIIAIAESCRIRVRPPMCVVQDEGAEVALPLIIPFIVVHTFILVNNFLTLIGQHFIGPRRTNSFIARKVPNSF